MDRDTAVVRIQDGLGFRTDQADVIVLRLQEAQRDLERGKTLPRFMLAEDQTLSLLTGDNSVALPSDFLRRAPRLIRYATSTSDVTQTVPWRTYDEAYSQWSDSDPAGPKVAVLRSSTILVFPVADADYSLTWDYYLKGLVLDSNIENVWLANAPELLIGAAGKRIAMDLRNKSATALFTEMYAEARVTWFSETVEQESDTPLLLGANN